eukprot:353447-Chlamydomonas_euryale.AAC.5
MHSPTPSSPPPAPRSGDGSSDGDSGSNDGSGGGGDEGGAGDVEGVADGSGYGGGCWECGCGNGGCTDGTRRCDSTPAGGTGSRCGSHFKCHATKLNRSTAALAAHGRRFHCARVVFRARRQVLACPFRGGGVRPHVPRPSPSATSAFVGNVRPHILRPAPSMQLPHA